MADITGVLLAAGFSTRFGTNKLITELDQKPLIAHSAGALSPCDRVIAVVRIVDAALQSELRDHSIDCVFNTEPERGIGYSIACAVKATAQSSGWCLLPADMPYILPATTSQVIEALRAGSGIAAPFNNGRRGHPVGFDAQFYDVLSALDGDTGARHIIEQHHEQMTPVETADAGVLRDIDTAEDLGNR
ncbi:MAG: nucleotidyltransferase family protein [Thiotrichales bacterium]|nr:MAG: nucleotidyltransferase family protein [Thiotrichales bacterium]